MAAEHFCLFLAVLVTPGSVLRCSNVVAPRSTRYRIRETTVSDVVEDDVVERLVKVETDVAYIRVGMGELKSEIRAVRTELKSEISDVRSGLKDLRTELKGDIKELRSDMTSIKEQMSTMRVDMVMTRAWMLCQSAVLLGVMARGFHWV